jgi:hypothetical protein
VAGHDVGCFGPVHIRRCAALKFEPCSPRRVVRRDDLAPGVRLLGWAAGGAQAKGYVSGDVEGRTCRRRDGLTSTRRRCGIM